MLNIKQDIFNITNNLNGFAVEMTLTAPTAEVLPIKGLHTKIKVDYENDGTPVIVQKAHVSFSELVFTDTGYPFLDANGEVDLKGHLVTVSDSTGQLTYVIEEFYPDKSPQVGLIVCILGQYE